jgi:hypothetical protein
MVQAGLGKKQYTIFKITRVEKARNVAQAIEHLLYLRVQSLEFKPQYCEEQKISHLCKLYENIYVYMSKNYSERLLVVSIPL